jgi:hypothetical protein
VNGVRVDIGAVELQALGQALPGDYNLDGVVDAADNVLWRKTLANIVAPYSGADGNGNGVIDQDDLAVWRSNFGRSLAPAASSAASASADPRQELDAKNAAVQTSAGTTPRQIFGPSPKVASFEELGTAKPAHLRRDITAESAAHFDQLISSWYLSLAAHLPANQHIAVGIDSVAESTNPCSQGENHSLATSLDIVLANWIA